MLPQETNKCSASSERGRLLAMAISRWDNEGGAGADGEAPVASVEQPADVLPLTNAELVQLQIRVIALENLLAVLLANASDRQLSLARKLASCIAPRPGFTPHLLTIHAAARMLGLLDRSNNLHALRLAEAGIDNVSGGSQGHVEGHAE